MIDLDAPFCGVNSVEQQDHAMAFVVFAVQSELLVTIRVERAGWLLRLNAAIG